jgi:hypothetical protein
VKLEAVCTQKSYAIGFTRFPARIRSHEGHDALSDLLTGAIPEINAEGLDGGFYRQTLHIYITIDCEDMTAERDAEIRDTFVHITKEYCRLK